MLVLDWGIVFDVVYREYETCCPLNGTFHELLPLEFALSKHGTELNCRQSLNFHSRWETELSGSSPLVTSAHEIFIAEHVEVASGHFGWLISDILETELRQVFSNDKEFFKQVRLSLVEFVDGLKYLMNWLVEGSQLVFGSRFMSSCNQLPRDLELGYSGFIFFARPHQ